MKASVYRNATKGVLVVHPGLQHAHQLAWALQERGLLKLFWSGVPVKNGSSSGYWWLPEQYRQKVKFADIHSKLRRHSVIFPAMRRVSKFLPVNVSAPDYERRLDQAFDWWVSKSVRGLSPSVVVAYENSAYHTFRAAKAIGATCILDAASVHHSIGSRLFTVKHTPHLAETNRRLDCEVDTADVILTCSQLAADSYIAAGVPHDKLVVLPLGASVQRPYVPREPHSSPLEFLFAGVLSHRKSIDIILAAFGRLNSDGLNARLTLVGGEGEPGWIKQIRRLPNARYIPSTSQNELHDMMGNYDCILLPSRVDSFGMVVAEAMACGTPAIVSDKSGASMIIAEYPGSGWIIRPDVDELYSLLCTLLENRQCLFDARDRAYQASLAYSWAAYRTRAGEFFSSLEFRSCNRVG